MPVNLDFEFFYPLQPVIAVSIRSAVGPRFYQTGAYLDTGAEVTLFDTTVAVRAGIDITAGRQVTIIGVAGDRIAASLTTVTLRLLDEPELEVTLPVAFGSTGDRGFGNLIGLDVLEHFDFAISHRERLGYLGRSA
jgi:uncharacterized membrane protein